MEVIWTIFKILAPSLKTMYTKELRLPYGPSGSLHKPVTDKSQISLERKKLVNSVRYTTRVKEFYKGEQTQSFIKVYCYKKMQEWLQHILYRQKHHMTINLKCFKSTNIAKKKNTRIKNNRDSRKSVIRWTIVM